MSNVQTTTFPGARYVTKFAEPIEWDSSNAYEAIEAVQHQGFSYISKRPVPAGIQITDTRYWLLWADPNAQMAYLRDEVDRQGTTFSGQIAQLQEDVEGINKTTIALLGDSFTDAGFVNWPQYLHTDYTIVNNAHSGSGFTHGGSGGVSIPQAALELPNLISDPEKLKMVIVYGGVNDTGAAASETLTENEFLAAVNQTFTNIRQNYPNVPIVLGLTMGNQSTDAAKYNRYKGLTNLAKQSCDANGGTYVNSFRWLLPYYNNSYQSDGLHPNQLGAKTIAGYMQGIIDGGYNENVFGRLSGMSPNEGGTVSSNGITLTYLPDNNFHIYAEDDGYRIACAFNFTLTGTPTSNNVTIPIYTPNARFQGMCIGAAYDNLPVISTITEDNVDFIYTASNHRLSMVLSNLNTSAALNKTMKGVCEVKFPYFQNGTWW